MRLRTRSALIAAASFLTASAASGATVDETRSIGSAALHWESRQTIVGPQTNPIGGSSLNVVLSVNFDPVADPKKPLLLVDMPTGAVVEATWSDDQNIDLVVTDGGNKTGTFKVEHTLAPHVTLNYNFFSGTVTGSYDWNAETLLDKIPGSNWDYVGTGTSSFDPWGFTAAATKLTAPQLNNAQLFSIPLEDLIGDIDVEGILAINATTDPTFEYQTTEVTLNGSADKLDGSNRTFRIPTTDADYLDVPVLAKGRITFSGVLKTRPSVTITRIGGLNIPAGLGTIDLGGAVSVDTSYASSAEGIPVEFAPVTVHIPLPNVKAQKSLDFGNVEVGKSESLKAEIKNTGEMQATVSFKSSDPQFFVVSGKQTASAKGAYELEVKFTPTSDGPASADITVESNDPNEPVQIIKVTGNGARIDDGTGDGEGFNRGDVDSGCGCKTTPAPTNAAGLGVFGIGLVALLRRRRRA